MAVDKEHVYEIKQLVLSLVVQVGCWGGQAHSSLLLSSGPRVVLVPLLSLLRNPNPKPVSYIIIR